MKQATDMRFILLILSLLTIIPIISAQTRTEVFSKNNWDLNQTDTLDYSQSLIKANKIKQFTEYLICKKYSDTPLIMELYFFDSSGAIYESRSFDIDGKPNINKNIIAPNGKISEHWLMDKKDILIKGKENFYLGNNLIKEITYYGKDYNPSIEYTYSSNGLLSTIQYFGPTGTKGAKVIMAYDSLNRLISEITKYSEDTVVMSYIYKYDTFGRRYFTEYKETNSGWIETIDYSKSKKNSIIEKVYLNNKLDEIRSKTFNKHGLVTKIIIDKRMSIAHSKTKSNMFCGNSSSVRYRKNTYKYHSNKNSFCEKKYYAPNKVSEHTHFEFDNNGLLTHKREYEKLKLKSEWLYIYKL